MAVVYATLIIKGKKTFADVPARIQEQYQNENMEIAVHEVGEDNTKYGEFVSTYFAWIPLSKQKERAREMEVMTKKDKTKSK